MSMQGSVIVSGGTFGIGRAIAVELARRGFPVLAFGLEARQPGSLAQDGIRPTRDALREAGAEAELLEADVASASDVARVVEHAVRVHGGVRAIVNNAAIRPTGTLLETDEATFDRVLAVNLKGPFLLCRAAIPHMRAGGGGAIVNVGSGAAAGRAGLLAYSASKGALLSMTRALALDCARDGIRANLVVPAPGTPSGMVAAMREAGTSDRGSDRARAQRAAPTDVARVVAFLLSPAAAAATGEVFDVATFRAPEKD